MRLAGGFLLAALACSAANVSFPEASGPLTIDGAANEEIWRHAREFALAPAGGGEFRAMLREGYLCLSARIPEEGRVVAHSTGANPAWWSEDLLVWRLRVPVNGRNVMVSVAVNPAGAWRVEPEPDIGVLAAARIERGYWSVEAAIPAARLGPLGFIGVERIRAARPNSPEQRWYWPEPNSPAPFELASTGLAAAPEFRPAAWRRERAVAPAAPFATDVWTGEESKAARHALMRHLRARMAKAAATERGAWDKVRSRAHWERFRDARISALRESLGRFPERTPLRAVVTRRLNFGSGFVIENVVFESRPGLLVTANLYLPEKIAGRIPAVVMVHSHHAPKTQAELQDMGMTWARAGAAVLVMDQPGAGERLQSQPWPRESYYSRYPMGMQLELAGESLMQWMVWDLMRAIDMLTARDYIDPARIVMIGAVAGGGDPAAVAAALDPRIAAVAPFNFGEASPEEHYREGPRPYDSATASPGWGDWETTRSLRGSAKGQFFPWLICAASAPRGFLFSFEMGWPKTVEEEPIWKRYRAVFDFYGKRERLDEVHGLGPFPGPGECTNVSAFHRKQIYPVLERWLGVPVPAQEFHDPRPDADLMCLTRAIAAERKLKTVSELALAAAERKLAAARARRRDAGELRAAFRAKLGEVEPNSGAAVRPAWSRAGAEAFSLATESDLSIPVVLLKPGAPRFPVVIGLAQEGKARFVAERWQEISRLLKAGIGVCLPDLRGTGEMAATESRAPTSQGLSSVELMLGDTLLGARIKDARTLFRYLAGRPDVDAGRIALWGESFAPVNRAGLLDQSLGQASGPETPSQAEPLGPLAALFTAMFEERAGAVAMRRGLASFLSVLGDRFSYVPRDVIVPGILEAGDIEDVARALAPRPVLTAGPVDGRNVALENAGHEDVAGWLEAQLRRE